MEKLLLTGLKDGFYTLIKKELEEEYRVDECEFGNSIRRSIRMEQPRVVVCFKDVDMQSLIIFETRECFPEVGMVVICDEEDDELDISKDSGMEILHRPVKESDIKDAIKKVIVETTPKETKQRILAVDDNAMVLRSIKEVLGQKYDVSLATSGKKALETLPKKKFDLVLLDYEMPQMNGYEVFKEMKANRDIPEVPVLFLTGIADKTKVMEVYEIKPAGYLLKPIDSRKLTSEIERVLG